MLICFTLRRISEWDFANIRYNMVRKQMYGGPEV